MVVDDKSIVQVEDSVSLTILGIEPTLARIIIPALISIIIFFLGFFINWIKTKYERKSELNSIKSVITTWIKLLKNPILQQVAHSRQFAITLRKSTELHPDSFATNPLLANKLQDIKLADLIQVFVINSEGSKMENSKHIFNIVSQLEFLTNIEKQIPEVYKIYQDLTFEYMKRWNDEFMKLDIIRSEMISQIAMNTTHQSYALFQNFNTVSNAYVNRFPIANIVETKIHLLDPVNVLVNKAIISNPNDLYAHRIRNNIHELNTTYRQWKVHFEGNSKLFYDVSIRLIRVYKTLQKASNELNNTKLKSVWKIK